MPSAESYDAMVIGSGQAGTPLSRALAEAGMRTALIEKEHVGGTCINEGCTPTKTMIASGRVAYLVRRAADYGVKTSAVRIDMARIRKRKRDVVDSFRGGSEKRLKKTKNLDLIYGLAAFTGPKTIEVTPRGSGRPSTLQAGLIFINVGCRPSLPRLPGLDAVPHLDSTSIMELARVPKHLLILGGGYIALEFGQLFRRLGSRVTILQHGPQLISREDPDIADAVAEILREDGVQVFLNAEALEVQRSHGTLSLKVKIAGTARTLQGTHLLLGTGRVPNSDTLNLSQAGIKTDARGYIQVNEKLETNVPGIFALGDVKGGPAFTHISYDDFRIIRTNLIEKGNATTLGRLVPYTLFTDPELGRVGLSEKEARAQGRSIRIAKMSMSSVARALEVDETRGFMKVIVDATSNRILGASVLGIEGGEIMSQIQIAMMGGLPYTALKDGIFAHPTLSESLNNLFNHFEK